MGLAEALQLEPNAIEPGTKLPEDWDSVAILATIALMDQLYGVTLSRSEIEKCRTVADLIILGKTG